MTTTFVCLLSIALSGMTYADVGDPPPLPEESVLDSTEMVLPLDSAAPRPTIEFRINGEGPFLFVFDTVHKDSLSTPDSPRNSSSPSWGRRPWVIPVIRKLSKLTE